MIIVLVHGFPGFARLEPIPGFAIDYFNGVKPHLEHRFRDLKVLVSELSPFGSSLTRAKELESQIPCGERVHIFAHSGGGKDSRLLVSPDGRDRSDLVASVTTISTPHHGSVIADLLAEPLGQAASLVTKLGPLAEAVKGFTSEKMSEFNNEFRKSDNVQYFSFAGVAGRFDRGIVGTIFAATHPLIFEKEGENDGWVSKQSATYPNSLTGTFRADHAGEVGHNLSLPGRVLDWLLGSPFDHLEFYATLAANLGAVRS